VPIRPEYLGARTSDGREGERPSRDAALIFGIICRFPIWTEIRRIPDAFGAVARWRAMIRALNQLSIRSRQRTDLLLA
jgi:hypothetical protein